MDNANPTTAPTQPKHSSKTPLVAITTALVCSVGAIYGTLTWTKSHPEALNGQFPFGIQTLLSTNNSPRISPEQKQLISQLEEAPRTPPQPPRTPPTTNLPPPEPPAPTIKTTALQEPKPDETITPPPTIKTNPTPDTPPQSSDSDKRAIQRTIEPVDPQDPGINTNDGPEKAYEQTKLTVGRTLAAQLDNNERQLLRLEVPVMYKSRTLRLDEETQKEAQELLKQLKAESQKLQERKASIQARLNAWNKLVAKTTPASVLLPESPSLPNNQTGTRITQGGNPNLAPGKGINYEVAPLPKGK